MGEVQGVASRERRVETGDRILGKSQRLLRCEATISDYFMFISAEKATFPIDWMCHKLKVSRAWFYRWLLPAEPTKTQVRHDELDAHVVRVYDREKGKAGRDQITTLLGQEGVSIATGTVGSIMTDRGLRAVRMRAWKKTTTVDPDARTEHIKNHMLDKNGKRDFTSLVPGTRLCGDITYLRTGSGWLYLATVIDLSTRMIVGWSMASHMRTSLIIDALTMARDHGHLDANGAIFNSDRGAQYTSGDFQKWCSTNGVTQSMGAVGVSPLTG
ncbi:IS3 family transposase [Arthrobacter oryzae]|uniref:IS3 family transposase n=1 Tax=Arthrobacter oryzae TaxID=409290 RepID=UPI0016059E7C|nr:IS3 family transposase [Arthrobacter oryzae]